MAKIKRVVVFVIISSFFILFNTSYIYSISIKDEAPSYREKGYEAQEAGNIDEAISWYQKAANLDPNYAAPHNDLGILFEVKGWLDRAEAEYQKAIAIDPDYAKAHTNLALLYERKGELEKAAFHWMRRYKLGRPGDPWTEEARKRLEKLGLLEKGKGAGEKERGKKASVRTSKKKEAPGRKSGEWTELRIKGEKEKTKKKAKRRTSSSKKKRPERKKRRVRVSKESSEWQVLGPAGSARERGYERGAARYKERGPVEDEEMKRKLEESLRLAEERLRKEREQESRSGAEVARRPHKREGAVSSEKEARPYLQRARSYLLKGEYTRALDEIRSAKKRYPDNPDLLKLEDDVKDKMKEERIKDHYSEAIMKYNNKDYKGAREEIEAILNILPE